MRISDWSSDVCSSDLQLCQQRGEASTSKRHGATAGGPRIDPDQARPDASPHNPSPTARARLTQVMGKPAPTLYRTYADGSISGNRAHHSGATAHARTNRHMDCKAVITHATSANQATTTHCRSAANQRHTHKTAGTLLRLGKRETNMRKH